MLYWVLTWNTYTHKMTTVFKGFADNLSNRCMLLQSRSDELSLKQTTLEQHRCNHSASLGQGSHSGRPTFWQLTQSKHWVLPCLSGMNNLSLKRILSEALSRSNFLVFFSLFFFLLVFHLDNASLPIKCYVSTEYLTFMGVRYLLGS